MDKKLIFHYDGGHGWLEVKASAVAHLGIADKISACSYKRGDKVYLEEDRDAPLYIKASGISNNQITDRHDGDNSPIRGFERYR